RGTIRSERAISPLAIIAHRGFSSKAPENTVPSITIAADYLADYAEIDVQCTNDGQVVLFHDRNLRRLAKDIRALHDMTLEELAKIDIGTYFSMDYAGLHINTLEEALFAAKDRIRLIVELKRNKAGDDLVPLVLDLIEKYEMEDQCIIQSSDDAYLKEVKERNPDMITGIILDSVPAHYKSGNEHIDFYCVRSAFVTQSSVRKIQSEGRQIFAWTINSRAEMERMKRLQVDGIITDYPIMAREVLYRQDEDDFLLYISEQLQKAADEREKGEGGLWEGLFGIEESSPESSVSEEESPADDGPFWQTEESLFEPLFPTGIQF
ncbi:MAG: hypothetical protein IKN57_08470, partial [Parasporobacterium sp.]|nr:hypothetical protein [Parasporobacterium sp.]